jgi:murein endopeptidase
MSTRQNHKPARSAWFGRLVKNGRKLVEMILIRSKIVPKLVEKWSKNGRKMVEKWSKNGRKMVEMILIRPNIVPKLVEKWSNDPDLVKKLSKICPKNGRNDPN